jgi:hypothetical protein
LGVNTWGEDPYRFTAGLGIYSDSAIVTNCTVVNGLGSNFQMTGNGGLVQDCKSILEDGEFTYGGWQAYQGYGGNGTFKRCSFYSPTMTHGFESLDGQYKFIDCSSTNGFVAFNSSPGYVDGFTFVITKGSYNTYTRPKLLFDCNQFLTGDHQGTGYYLNNINIVNEDDHLYDGFKGRAGTKQFVMKNIYFKQRNGVGYEFPFLIQVYSDGTDIENVVADFDVDQKVYPCAEIIPDDWSIIGLKCGGSAILKNITCTLIASQATDLIKENIKGCLREHIPIRADDCK